MLTRKQIIKKFECEAFDAREIFAIQKQGFEHGKAGQKPDGEDFDVGIDIEHVEALLFAEPGEVRAVYDAAWAEGAATQARKKAA